jgi:predicted nucleic acid-binding protein
MPDNAKSIYWDTSVFLCFLNPLEEERRSICEDILRHAKVGDVELYTSTYTIAEVIRPKRKDIPNSRRLTSEEVADIEGMFRWTWLKKIDVEQRVAYRAVDLSRDYELSPADAVHAASAIVWGVDELQHWERGGFNHLSGLITVGSPKRITPQGVLMDWQKRIGPAPDTEK